MEDLSDRTCDLESETPDLRSAVRRLDPIGALVLPRKDRIHIAMVPRYTPGVMRLGLPIRSCLIALSAFTFAAIAQVDAPATQPATAPATTRAGYDVELSRFDDESVHAPLKAFEAWINHLASGEIEPAAAMMPITQRATAELHRRVCRNLSKEYRKPDAAPRVLACHVAGETAVLMLALHPPGAKQTFVRRFYLFEQDGNWHVVGFNVTPFVDMYDDEQFKRLQEADDWASRREHDFKPGS
jgi:hypothetical protein